MDYKSFFLLTETDAEVQNNELQQGNQGNNRYYDAFIKWFNRERMPWQNVVNASRFSSEVQQLLQNISSTLMRDRNYNNITAMADQLQQAVQQTTAGRKFDNQDHFNNQRNDSKVNVLDRIQDLDRRVGNLEKRYA